MNKEEIIKKAFELPSLAARPEHFTNYNHCCECKEHDEELLAHTPQTITREALGTMGWDPITFTTDEGFRHYLPGMIRVVLTETGDQSYYEQFLWHVLGDRLEYKRMDICTEQEREVICDTLNYLLHNKTEEIEIECLTEDLLNAIELLSCKVT